MKWKRITVMTLAFLSAGCRGDDAASPPESEVQKQVGDEHAAHGDTPRAAAVADMAGMSPEEHAAMVKVDPQVAKALGIRTVEARAGATSARRRAPATVTYDPTRLVRVSAQPGGQVRVVDVPRIGESVKQGRLLARLYAPEVRSGFEELLLARDLGEPWMTAARQRLRSGGVLDADIDQAIAEGRALDTYAVRAPVSGVVVARSIAEGSWTPPGGVLVVLAQAGAVVVEVVTPADHPVVGTPVVLSDPASTGERWNGTVEAILSSGDATGHAVRVAIKGTAPRVGIPLVAEWDASAVAGVWVPRGAVIDTGERRVVFVATTGGAYSPRNVKLGARTADEIQVLEGLAAGEAVVAAGTFLLDSETQMTSGGHAGHGG